MSLSAQHRHESSRTMLTSVNGPGWRLPGASARKFLFVPCLILSSLQGQYHLRSRWSAPPPGGRRGPDMTVWDSAQDTFLTSPMYLFIRSVINVSLDAGMFVLYLGF